MYTLRLSLSMILMLLVPLAALAHREAECDGSKMIRINVPAKGIVQIKTTEPLTGVYPATPQGEPFIVYDPGSPKHLFRIDAGHMQAKRTVVHVNTMGHQCLLDVRQTHALRDSVVTITYPKTHRDLEASLPPPLRESPVRQLWFAQWLADKHKAPATVNIDQQQRPLPSWIPGLTVRLIWHYTMPGFEGYSQELTNTTPEPLAVHLTDVRDARRPLHSASMTDATGYATWRPSGLILPGETALLHTVYKSEER